MASCKDDSLLQELECQLRANKLSWLEISPIDDYNNGPISLAIYGGILYTGISVVDAWIINGNGMTRYYNRSNYPNIEEAIASHIGALVMGSSLKINSDG